VNCKVYIQTSALRETLINLDTVLATVIANEKVVN